MTSNLGSQMIQQMAGDDYQVVKLAVMAEVKSYFRPELINRIDEVVVFPPWAKRTSSRCQDPDEQPDQTRGGNGNEPGSHRRRTGQIADAGFDPVYGARRR